MVVIAVTIILLIAHQGQCLMKATAILYPNGLHTPMGSLNFTQENADSPVRIYGATAGLAPHSAHGFHIHDLGVAPSGPDCAAAGPHFNPYGKPHGPPTADIDHRHVGDLGNITADENGATVIDIQDAFIQLYNTKQSILSRTVVIHQIRDDGGQGGFSDSDTTGNSGARILCGLIILSDSITAAIPTNTQPVAPSSEHTTPVAPTTEHTTPVAPTTEHSTPVAPTTEHTTTTTTSTPEPGPTSEHTTTTTTTTTSTPEPVPTSEHTTTTTTTTSEAPMTTITVGNTTMSFSTRINVQPVMLVFTTVMMITNANRA